MAKKKKLLKVPKNKSNGEVFIHKMKEFDLDALSGLVVPAQKT